MEFGTFGSLKMPPYSTDPELSRLRHIDPEYVDSSDIGDTYSDSTAIASLDAFNASSAMASSPPKLDSMDADFIMEDFDAEDEPTDDDEEQQQQQQSSGTMIVDTLSARKGQLESTIRPGSFVLAARASSSMNLSVEKLIASVFDNEQISEIHLDNRELKEVPSVFRDLAAFENLGKRKFKLNLSVNKLFNLNKCLYDIRNLEYLSLRFNRIEELSPLIGQLTELRELHLGNNILTTLPIELTKLHNLRTLTTYPNEFLPLPKSGKRETFLHLQTVPSLVELAQRSLAQAGFEHPFEELKSIRSRLATEVPESMLVKLLDPFMHSTYIGRVCSICRTAIIKPAALHLHWKKHGEDRSGEIVPYQTTFCSGRCLSQFNRSLDDIPLPTCFS